MFHNSSYTIEIDCAYGHVPKAGDTFTLKVVRDEQFEVTHVVPYPEPQAREYGLQVTHHIRYRRKP
jgi:hypothetical protein